jgi:predicted RNA-binding Zn-ribbon protein involved in translation (DUF1610 family)
MHANYCPDCEDVGCMVLGVPNVVTSHAAQFECPECGLKWVVQQEDKDE